MYWKERDSVIKLVYEELGKREGKRKYSKNACEDMRRFQEMKEVISGNGKDLLRK